MPLPLKSLSLLTITLLLSLVSPIYLKGTSLKISEVPAQAQTTQDRKTEANRLLQQGLQQHSAGQLEAALQSLQRALIIYQEIQDRLGEGQVLKNVGNVYYAQKDYKKAIEFQQQALKIAKEIRDRDLEGRALNNLGLAYKELGDSAKAIEYYQQALAIAQEIHNRQLEQITLSNLGFIHVGLGNSAKVIEYYQQALPIIRELKERSTEAAALAYLGDAYASLDENQKAMEFAQQALTLARETKNSWAEAIALDTLSRTYSSLGDAQTSLEFAQASLKVSKELKNSVLEGRALVFISDAYNSLGNYQKAIDFAHQGLTVAVTNKNRDIEGLAMAVMGNASDSLWEYQKAVEYAHKALEIAREVKNKKLEAYTLVILGSAYNSLAYSQEDYQKAIDFTQQGLALVRELKDRFQESRALAILGSAYDSLEEYQKSIEFNQQALAIAQETKNPLAQVYPLVNLSVTYTNLGDYQKVLKVCQQGLAMAQQFQSTRLEWIFTLVSSLAYFGQGNFQKSLALSERSLELLDKLESSKTEQANLKSAVFLILSISHAELKHYEKSRDFAEQAVAITREVKNRDLEGNALSFLGEIYSKAGQQQQAIAAYQEALTLATSAGSTSSDYSVQAGLARVYQKLNMPITAITYYKQAISGIEETRGKIKGLPKELQESFLQAVQGLGGVKTSDIYRNLADLLLSQGRILEAQQVLELLKVQELRDFTKNTRAGGKNPEIALNQTEEQIKKENGTLIAFGQRIEQCQQARCSQLSQLLDQREALTEQFNQKIQTIEKQVRDRRTQDDAFLDPKKLGLKAKEIVEAQPGTVLIYPLVLEDKIWLLWASKGGIIKSAEVPKVGQKQLAQTVLKFRQLLQNPTSNIAELQATGKQLYDWLIRPIEPELKENKIQNLVFSLDRAARYIPMSALFDGEKYLIENYAVSTVLSADLTNTSDRIPPGTQNTSILALGLSNPVPGFNPLPNVPAELDAIVRKQPNDTKGIYPGLEFLNQDFDWRSLRDNLLGHKLLHIATHGEFVPGSPDASYLLLGTGEKLAIPKIATLQDLSNVSLVVLSACETALAGPGQDGTEINGISYYFLNAGAKTVMASLWKVDDDSTSQLMQNFYGNLAKGTANAPITKAEALRHAQLNLLRDNSSTTDNFEQRSSLGAIPRIDSQISSINRSLSEFSHPYYWAPFILIGNSL